MGGELACMFWVQYSRGEHILLQFEDICPFQNIWVYSLIKLRN